MIGKTAQNFVLKDQFSRDWELYKNVTRNVLLIFYPKDKTLVCSRQLNNYNSNLELFKSYNIDIVGINTGTVSSHNSFCDSLELKFPLLSDPDKAVSIAFNAVSLFGTNKRKLILINTSKTVVYDKTIFRLTFKNSNEIIKSLRQRKLIKMT